MLQFMRELVHLRREQAWVGYSDFEAMCSDDAAVMVHRVQSDAASLISVHNLSASPQRLELPDVALSKTALRLQRGLTLDGDAVEAAPYGFGWFFL